jgi:hypothetical protein
MAAGLGGGSERGVAMATATGRQERPVHGATATGGEGRAVHGATSTGREAPPGLGRKVTNFLLTWLAKVFELNSSGLNWMRGVMILDVLLVPLVVFWAIGYEQYLLSALFAVVWTAVTDPGGSYGYRASRMAVFGLLGAGLTALGFGIGGDAWGWLALAAFLVTLVAGLAVLFGVHRFTAAFILNIQFIIVLAIAFEFHHTHHRVTINNYTWAQVLAWAGGSALWIVLTFIAWLIRRRTDAGPPIAEIPSDTSRHPLTRMVIMFAVIRAVVVGGTIALAFGENLSHGQWMPIAAIVAMKPSLQQTALVGIQRLFGAAIGAGVAALLLLIPANESGLKLLSITHGLDLVAIVIFMHAAAIRFWNYALFEAAIVAGVLILLDLLQPSNYAAEGYRILWTFYGVAIGFLVMLLAGLLSKRTAKPQPQPA